MVAASSSEDSVARDQCPLCRSRQCDIFLTRKQVPVHQNLLFDTQEDARHIARGDLDMRACPNCGFIFNSSFDAGNLSYGAGYDNTQNCSEYFDDYLNTLVSHLVAECAVQRSRIVEIGCGKGSFLRKLVAFPHADNTGIGYDPSYTGPATEMGGRLQFISRTYDELSAKHAGDVVVCRHVIEHIANPVEFLSTVRNALGNSSQAKLFFETPCAEWILDGHVFWDFFYEHCSLFNKSSITTAFEAAGFKVESTRHVFHGQYLLVQASPKATSRIVGSDQTKLLQRVRSYADAEASILRRWKTQIEHLSRAGLLGIWGAGAKGVTFANLIDPECRSIDAVIDINPRKQGRFLPGSGHPIIDFRDIESRGITDIVLMNPNYKQENTELLDSIGIRANFVELK